MEDVSDKAISKKSRRKKSDQTGVELVSTKQNEKNNIVMIIEEIEEPIQETSVQEPVPPSPSVAAAVAEAATNILKKRGRKPKGGKLVNKKDDTPDKVNQVANVILHLKCSTHDLTEYNDKMNKIFTNPLSYNPSIPPSIMTYDINNTQSFSIYENIQNASSSIPFDSQVVPSKIEETHPAANTVNTSKVLAYDEYTSGEGGDTKQQVLCAICSEKIGEDQLAQLTKLASFGSGVGNPGGGAGGGCDDDAEINIKDINVKLKNLKLSLYKNTNLDKKSACFWCTYDYDNQPCYIPKYELDGSLFGYGSFCRPECAVAFLMKENIDDSMKFERYNLLNQIYSKVYNFKKNIKPAPDPHFLLEKFYGNLTIQEYRKLLKTEHMLLVVEKPMTLILPELHDDNDDFVMNIYGGKTQTNPTGSGVYKVKKQSEKQKGPTKTTIMKENFGF